MYIWTLVWEERLLPCTHGYHVSLEQTRQESSCPQCQRKFRRPQDLKQHKCRLVPKHQVKSHYTDTALALSATFVAE